MTIDLGNYLKRVNNNQGNYYSQQSDYVIPTQQQNNNIGASLGNVPNEAYNKDGSINYRKLEGIMSARNGVNVQMTGWNPIDGNIYLLSGDSDHYEWDSPMMHASTFSNGIEKVQTSSSILSNNEIDNLLFHAIRPQYQDKFAEMLDRTEGDTTHAKLSNLFQHGSGIITSLEFQDLTTAALNARLITKQEKANILAGFFDTETTTENIIPFEEFEPPSVQEDLGELEIPRTVQGRYTGFSIGLKKDGWHMAWTRFFTGQARRRNVISDHLTWLGQDFDRVINERIALVLNSIASTAGSSWSSFATATDLRNQNDPTTVINTVSTLLETAGYPPEFSLSNRRVKQDYSKNTYVKGALTGQPAQGTTRTGVDTLELYGWRHGIDSSLADSTMWILNSAVGTRVQGAVLNITYTEPKAQVFGAISYNYNNFALKKATAGRRITGIT